MSEGHSSDREETIPDLPVYRARASDATAWRTTFFILGGGIGLLGFFWSVTSQLSETLRVEVRNERVERINADNRLDARVYELERRRR